MGTVDAWGEGLLTKLPLSYLYFFSQMREAMRPVWPSRR